MYSYAVNDILAHTIQSLSVEAKANAENAKVEIIGNDELKSGTNEITIKISVTDEAGLEEQKTYTIKSGGFNKSMTIKKANYSNLEGIIESKGKPIELIKYRYSKGKKTTKARVLQSSGLKSLEKNGIKAFVTKFANGHASIAQRRGKERLPIKILFSNSIPMMIGNEKRVYGIVEPEINDYLRKKLDYHISKVLGGYE